MMPFSPSTFNHINQLIAASQSSTVKGEQTSSTTPTTEDILRNIAGGLQPMALFPSFIPGLGASTGVGASFPILMPQEMKPDMMGGGTPGGGPMMPFMDAFGGFHPYAAFDGSRRKNATRETTAPLKAWLTEHRKNPYPTKAEKVLLACMTKMTLTQVSTWFANARRRLKKENKMTWSPRNRPGDDDDDIGEADLERPGSSKSDVSGEGDCESNNNDNQKDSPLVNGLPSCENGVSPSKKIWSITDTAGVSDDKDDGVGSSKKDTSPTSSTASDAHTMNSVMAAWHQQLMSMSRQIMPTLPVNGGHPMSPNLFNPLFMASMMHARLGGAVPPFFTTPTPHGRSIVTDAISSLSPSSSIHSDSDKPPTLINSSSPINEENIKKESTVETPESN